MNARLRILPRRGAALAAAAALALALAGCSATRTSPVKQTYLLDPPPPAAVAKAQASTLRVDAVNVAAPYRGRGFVFRESDLRYETDYYNEFIVAPAANIAEVTARGLQKAGAFSRVTGPGAPVDADWLLEGFVNALYGDTREAAKPAAEVSITYYLTRAEGGSGVPLWSREYSRRVPLASASAGAYAAALNVAVGEIVAELAKDLAAAQLPAK
jgi:cholesterol transport system auxiliary component